MATREEIRRGIEDFTDRPAALWAYLHSLQVVIKVKRELPENPYPESIFPMGVDEGARIQREKLGDKLTTSVNGGFGRHVYNFCQGDMLKAGYAAVEPLVDTTLHE